MAITRQLQFLTRGSAEYGRRRVYDSLAFLYSQFARPSDAVVILGFPRSGTTFLVEAVSALLPARTMFEPLHHSVAPARRFLHPHWFVNDTTRLQKGFPYRRPHEVDPLLSDFFQRILTGAINQSRLSRYRSLSSFRTKNIVVKETRGTLLASWLANTFQVRIILLIRNPIAVVESVQRQRFGWWLQDASFLSLFTDQEELVEDWLTPFLPFLNSQIETGAERIAAGWSIANMVPLIQAREGIFSPLIIRYDDLVLEPEATFRDICEFLGVDYRWDLVESMLKRPSTSTQKTRRDISARERVFGWQNRVSEEVADSVKRVVATFGPPLTDYYF